VYIYAHIRSGWNPFLGLRVSLKDECLSAEKVSIIIEPGAPGSSMCCFMACTPMIILLPMLYPIAVANSQARGYFFYKNSSTGRIDLLYRLKPFMGREIRTEYEDVTYFGVIFSRDEAYENLYTSSFVVTFKNGQIRIPNGECFVLSHNNELDCLMEAVNTLIVRSLEGRHDLNTDVCAMLSTGRADERFDIPFAPCSVLSRSESQEFANVSADCIHRGETMALRGSTSRGSLEEESIATEREADVQYNVTSIVRNCVSGTLYI
jgi:hypothetical protein